MTSVTSIVQDQINAAIQLGELPATAVADTGFYRALVVAAWKQGHIDTHAAIAEMYNHGFRGAALDLRAS